MWYKELLGKRFLISHENLEEIDKVEGIHGQLRYVF